MNYRGSRVYLNRILDDDTCAGDLRALVGACEACGSTSLRAAIALDIPVFCASRDGAAMTTPAVTVGGG